jgi:hypothetical protein
MKPLQSNASGPLAPHWYGLPAWSGASANAPRPAWDEVDDVDSRALALAAAAVRADRTRRSWARLSRAAWSRAAC